MSHPANTHQAHAAHSGYLYPNHSNPNPQPRSSSLPFLMGLNQSKPTPPTPTAANVAAAAASKGFTAAVAGGIKLKRAFAARRKKSEDASSLFNSKHDSPTTSSSQVADKSLNSSRRPPALQQPPPSSSSLPHSTPPADTQISNIKTTFVPPSPSPSKQFSLSPTQNQNRGPGDANTNMNRTSVIPLSPGISSAVNYMTMYDQPSSPVSSPSSPEKDKEKDKEKEKEKEKENKRETKESWRKSDSTNSHHTIRPGGPGSSTRNSRPVSWAESFQSAYTVVQNPTGTSTGSSPSITGTGSRPLSVLMGDADFSMLELEEELEEVDDDDTGVRDNADAALDRSAGFNSIPAATETKAATSAHPPSTPAAASASMINRRSVSLDVHLLPTTTKPLTTFVSVPASAFATGQAQVSSTSIPPEMRHPSHTISEGLPPSGSGSSHSHSTYHHPPGTPLSASAPTSQPPVQSTPSTVNPVNASVNASNNSTRINTNSQSVNPNNTNTHPNISAPPPTSAPSTTSTTSGTSTPPTTGAPNPTSAVHMHNERILPSLPSSSVSSASSASGSFSSFSSSYSSAPASASAFEHQQQQRIRAQQQQAANNRAPLQPVRQQMSMPVPMPIPQAQATSTSTSSTGASAGAAPGSQQQQQRQYEYQYPLQLSPPPQSQPPSSYPQSHSPQPRPHPHPQNPQTRAHTISLSSPSSSSSTGMGASMGTAAAGLAKRAVEKMGMGRKWAMGVGMQMGIGGGGSSSGGNGGGGNGGGGRSASVGGAYGGESDRERGERERERGTGNGSTSSASASGAGTGTPTGTGSASGYSSSSGGSMFECRAAAASSSGAGGPNSNSNSSQKFMTSPSKINHTHTSRNRHGGGAGSVSSISTDSHGHSDGFGASSFGSVVSGSCVSAPRGGGGGGGGGGVYQQGDGPMLGLKLRAGSGVRSASGRDMNMNMNMGGMNMNMGGGMRTRGMGMGGLVFKRDLSACVRDTGVWVGRSKESANVNKEGGAKQARGKGGRNLVAELESRKLPALVVRCAQHLLLWGIQEEGLFRVSGMPQHVTRLRAEFDSGADYDMTECTPGDLDPHAVASVFKAYLRELPEPILTQKLQPYFDAAVNKETNINTAAAAAATAASVNGSEPTSPTRMTSGGRSLGLPSGPKSGFNAPLISPPSSSSSSSSSSAAAAAAALALRKAPSLSTLAMPSFTGIPPPSPALTASFRVLIEQLPQENKDLMRTVVDLIKATARESKETKMPLSNLLLVFCPSLNMTPPLLKVLCDAEGIWGVDEGDDEDLLDIRRRTVVPNVPAPVPVDTATAAEDVPPPLPAKDHLEEDAKSTADTEEEGSVISGRASLDTTDNNLSSDYHASAEEEEDGSSVLSSANAVRNRRRRQHLPQQQQIVPASARESEVPTVYLDSRSYCSTASSVSSLVRDSEDDEEDDEGRRKEADVKSGSGEGETTPGVNTFFHQQSLRDPARDDALSVSSGGYSMNNMPISSPPPLSSSAESVATHTSSGNPSFTHLSSSMGGGGAMEKEDDHEHEHSHEHSSALHPHIVETTPLELKPQQSMRGTISAPIVSPAPATAGNIQPVQFPSSSPSPYHHFPYPEPTVSQAATTKSKRRSIPILSLPNFSPSIAPLLPNMSPAPSSAVSGGSPHSLGFTGVGQEKTLRGKKPSLKLLFSKRSASSLTSMRDSKGIAFISNPIPQNQGQEQGQGQQPLTPFSATSAIYNYRHSPKSASDSSVSTPLSAVTAPQSSLRSVSANGTMNFPPVLDTPIDAGTLGLDYGFDETPPTTKEVGEMEAQTSQSQMPQTAQRRAVVGRGSQQRSAANQQQQSTQPLSVQKKMTLTTGEDRSGSGNQIRPQASCSNLSIMSTASSHHLSLFGDDDNENVEDWTQSVLLAADVDFNWAIQKPDASS